MGGRPGGDMAPNVQQMLANIDRDKNGKDQRERSAAATQG